MTLKVASNIQSQASVLSTVGTMNGNRMAARVNLEKTNFRCGINASHIPSTVLNTVAVAVKSTVLTAVSRKILLSACLR